VRRRVLLPAVAAALCGGGCSVLGFDAWLEGVVDPESRPPPVATAEVASDDFEAASELPGLLALETGARADYVARVGERLARYTLKRAFAYRFLVLRAPEPDSFSLPGGRVYVSSGLLDRLEGEAELAAVLAHELAHASERGLDPQRAMLPEDSPLALPLARLGELAAYPAEAEARADHRGRRIAAASGYEHRALERVFERGLAWPAALDERPKRYRLPGLAATHGLDESRLEALRASAAALRPPQPDVPPVAAVPLLGRPAPVSERAEPGARIVRPGLGVAIELPRGWEVLEGARAFGARAPDGRAWVFAADEPLAQAPAPGLARHVESLRRALAEQPGMSVDDVQRCGPARFEGFSFRARLRSAEGDRRAEVALFRGPAGTLRVTAVAPAGDDERDFALARAALRSLAPLADPRVGPSGRDVASSGSGEPSRR